MFEILTSGCFQQVERSVDVDEACPNRVLGGVFTADDGGFMKDSFDVFQSLFEFDGISDVYLLEMKLRVTSMLSEVSSAPEGEIINHCDMAVLLQETVNKVASDEAGSARDQCSLKAECRGLFSYEKRKPSFSSSTLSESFSYFSREPTSYQKASEMKE